MDILASAKRRLLIADHFLTQTYPFVQDPKLLLNALEGIFIAAGEIMDAVLAHEHKQELTFSGKLGVFKGDIGKKYGFSHIDTHMFAEMQELLHEHKESAMEFQRKGQLYMASDNFKLTSLSIEKIKTYLSRTRTLYQRAYDTINT